MTKPHWVKLVSEDGPWTGTVTVVVLLNKLGL